MYAAQSRCGKVDGHARPAVAHPTPALLRVDAGFGFAFPAFDAAIDALPEMAANAGIAMAAIRRSHHFGQAGAHCERLAEKGLVAFVFGNTPKAIAPWGGTAPLYGTNPIAFGIPRADGPPMTFDMATSAIALFGVLTSKAKGEPLPPNVAYGKDGNWTTDAAQALEGGAIATFGGHKGAGLSLMIELLAGVLPGGAVLGECSSKKEAKSWGHTLIAIRPELLVDDFESKAVRRAARPPPTAARKWPWTNTHDARAVRSQTSVIQAVKASGQSIRLPGEGSSKVAAERQAAGTMPIPTKIWESICKTAKEGLPK